MIKKNNNNNRCLRYTLHLILYIFNYLLVFKYRVIIQFNFKLIDYA